MRVSCGPILGVLWTGGHEHRSGEERGVGQGGKQDARTRAEQHSHFHGVPVFFPCVIDEVFDCCAAIALSHTPQSPQHDSVQQLLGTNMSCFSSGNDTRSFTNFTCATITFGVS